MFTNGLHLEFAKGVIDRFRVLISSGIFGLWERWDRIRFSQSGLQSQSQVARHEKILHKPLSFDNYGTPWLLGFQIVVWVTTVIVFVIEIVRADFGDCQFEWLMRT